MFRSKRIEVVQSQAKVDKMFKKLKEKKETNSKNKKSKIIILAVALLVVLATIFGGVAYYKYSEQNRLETARKAKIEADRVEIKEKITLETGSEAPTLTSFIKKQGNLSLEDTQITFTNEDEEVSDKSLQVLVLYYDADKNNVTREEATEVTEESSEEILKPDYSKIRIVTGTGTYAVEIIDAKNEKTYEAKLVIKDTVAPEVTVKETVEITEGDNLDISMFIDKCSDGSFTQCLYKYVEVVTDENSKTTVNNLENIDVSVGEREITLVAYDLSGNETKVQKVTLKVNQKPQVVQSTGGYTGNTFRPSGNTGGNTGNTENTSNASSTSNGSASGGKTRNKCLYDSLNGYGFTVDWGCNSTLDMFDGSYDDELYKYAGTQTSPLGKALIDILEPCENALVEQPLANGNNDNCQSLANTMMISHRYDDGSQVVGSARGFYMTFSIYHNYYVNGILDRQILVAKGYFNSSFQPVYTMKTY